LENFRRTQLYDLHKDSAKLVPFAGFEMPIWYKGIIPEHLAVRNSVGVFDISHMGRVLVTGSDAESLLNHVFTNDVSAVPVMGAQYTVMCTENGGIIDDLVSYRLEKDRFLVVFNAGNRKKDYNWLVKNVGDFDVKIEDVSDDVAMMAVQGPDAEKTLQKICKDDLTSIGRFKCGNSRLTDVPVLLSRTGYTGEDGFEVFVWNVSLQNPENAAKVWNAVVNSGSSYGIEPCGLGARDTLRLEAGFCLYGNDIDENTTPLEANLGFVVKLQKEGFVGKETLQQQKADGVKRKRIGVKLLERGIPRSGSEIFDEKDAKIGALTSGTFSPLLKIGVGMGYVDALDAKEGINVIVKTREKRMKARIASFPLYDPEKYGYRRMTK
jgi:aminomethyltransferase